jgi:hypothetical protein
MSGVYHQEYDEPLQSLLSLLQQERIFKFDPILQNYLRNKGMQLIRKFKCFCFKSVVICFS